MKAPAERSGWVLNPALSWNWSHAASGARVFLRNTLRGGYWLAEHPKLRPYQWCDGILRGPRGYPRRFTTAEAAMLAAESVT